MTMPKEKSVVQILFNFDVIANVAPPSGTRSLDVLAADTVMDGGKRYASLLVGNSGTVHAKLSDATLTLRSGSWSQTLTPGELQLRLGAAVVQPGKHRHFGSGRVARAGLERDGSTRLPQDFEIAGRPSSRWATPHALPRTPGNPDARDRP